MKELASESGLGGLIGHAHHGVGILPVRLSGRILLLSR